MPVLQRCTPQGETTPLRDWDGNAGATPSPLLARDTSRGLAPVGKRPYAEEEEEMGEGDEEAERLASLAKRPRLIMGMLQTAASSNFCLRFTVWGHVRRGLLIL